MKILTWNINSVRIRLENLKKVKEFLDPDIICLQETKVQDIHFPIDELKKLGFEYIFFSGEKSYNGVAILSKLKIDKYFSLNLINFQKRHLAINIGDIEIHNFYVPAGGDIPDLDENPKFKHKLDYIKSIKTWFLENRPEMNNIIMLGDLNIAPYEHDVWSSKQLKNVVSHTDIERELLIDLMNSCNFYDVARKFVDHSEKLYSWWSYRNKDWKKSNRGRRLDHIWVTNSLISKVKKFEIYKNSRDFEKGSDHVPVMIEIL